MTRPAYIIVPGILNYPGNPDATTDRAVTWLHTHLPSDNAAAEKFEYMAGPVSRGLLANRRARDLARLIDRYPVDVFRLTIAAHSNGCDIVRRALNLCKRPANHVHLFAPAVIPSHRPSLKVLLRDGKIGFLYIHLATRDRMLTGRFLGGLSHAAVQAKFADEHHTQIYSVEGGHSVFFNDDNFEPTMQIIRGG